MKYFEQIKGEKYTLGDIVDLYFESGDTFKNCIVRYNEDNELCIDTRKKDVLFKFKELHKLNFDIVKVSKSILHNVLAVYDLNDDEDTILEKQLMECYDLSLDTKLKIIKRIEQLKGYKLAQIYPPTQTYPTPQDDRVIITNYNKPINTEPTC